MPQPAAVIQPAPSAVRRQLNRLARALALLVQLRKLQRDHLRDAAIVHGHAVEHVGRLDRAAVVGDEEELRPVGELAQRLREAADVALVERGIDLIEDAEGRGLDTQDREKQRRRCQRPLATGELRETTDALARGPSVDLDAGILGIVRGAERGLPAVEQALEEETELAI